MKPRPLAILAALFVFMILTIRPFGNYPLNDDWQYARVVKNFVATGQFKVDVPIAPSLVGQGLTVWPVIKIFGFSHTSIRIVTMLLAFLIVVMLERLLSYAEVPWHLRVLALALLLLTPLFPYFAMTFMTEIYGFFWAFAGVWLWFRARDMNRPLSVMAAVASGAMAGFSFWTRQYGVVVYPALVAASVFAMVLRQQWSLLARSIPAVIAGAAVVYASVWSYLWWTSISGNNKEQFQSPLSGFLSWDPRPWQLQSGIILVYMTAFFLPILVAFGLPKLRRWSTWLGLLTLTTIICTMSSFLYKFGVSNLDQPAYIHRVFPYLTNVIYNAGIGPLTIPDIYQLHLPDRPQWDQSIWKGIEGCLLASVVLWIPVGQYLGNMVKAHSGNHNKGHGMALEILSFGLLLAIGSIIAIIQAYKMTIFDRYLLPIQLGLCLALTILLAYRQQLVPRTTGWQKGVMTVALVALSFYTIGGIHDMFRWNDARWQLIDRAHDLGVADTNINAGFEVNGWLNYDATQQNLQPQACIGGHCGCGSGWYCTDSSYRVSMNLWDGYRAIDTIKPFYILVDDVPLMLSKRPEPLEP